MESRKRRSYTTKQREAVLADVRASGVIAASKKHDVPQSCVSRWASVAGVRREVGEQSAAAVASPSESESGAARADDKVSATPAAIPTAKLTLGSRVAKVYTPSQKAVVLEAAAKDGVTAAAKAHGISRFSIYDWQRRLRKAAAGEGPSPTSGPAPKDIEQQRDAEILEEWKTHPGLGPSQVRNQLRRKGVKVSVHTTRRVMEDAGYRPPKVVRQKHDRRYEAVRPNHLWHLDFVQRYIGRVSTFTLIVIDDCARYVVGHGVDDAERADMVIHSFEEATSRHGRPERVMTDKGSAFWSWKGISRFTALLTEMGIDTVVAEHKEWNGKVEVFNANLHKELFDAHRFYDVAEMRRRLETHIHWYNHARTHHALGGLLVPADRYYGRAAEVLARIEAGAGRDLGDGIELRERCLELFKVTSRGGVPEVWLLGQKLLGPPT
ncbi:MAG: DDE-type integrase/transposase/recombinase [Burkholderiales bacterium]|nr:DDE-type integrase/transposase/recombinase [Burkholderiales bacterium]